MERIGAENSAIVPSLIFSDQARKGEKKLNKMIDNYWLIFTWKVVVLAQLEA